VSRWRRGWTIVRSLTPFVLAFLRDRRRWLGWAWLLVLALTFVPVPFTL
jgi:hypothetical protein